MSAENNSSTYKRRQTTYLTPQNKAKLDKYVNNPDGTRRNERTKNKTINEALKQFFAGMAL